MEYPERNRLPLYQSGNLELDLAQRELRSNGVAIPIGRRAFEIMEVLVQSSGELVTKDDLMRNVWPGAVIEENSLQVQISAIRRALGPDKAMLVTVSGRGYRLNGSWSVRYPSTEVDQQTTSIASDKARPFRNNLPVGVEDLIGRSDEVRNVLDTLSVHRVITLTGPGGIGKTRLAIEAARRGLSDLIGDVFIVELASLTNPDLLPSAIGAAIGLSFDGTEVLPSSVARAIGEQKLLLLLDNCEHMIAAASRMADEIVNRCPYASVLATSREPLRIEGEYIHRVRALDVPREDLHDVKEILEHSAVRLFGARIKALRSDFSALEADIRIIASICRSIDGIPLAIELAAARAAHLGVQEVHLRLQNMFDLLAGGRRTALPHQQTLRATLDWSYELLPDTERRLLRRLAVFAGGFTLQAAISSMPTNEFSEAVVTQSFANLIEKSLITPVGGEINNRWKLLETVRAYALEKLVDHGEAQSAARSHAAFLRDLFAPEPQAAGLNSEKRDVTRFIQEIDNVRSALDWAFSSHGDAEIGILLTAAYAPVWLHLSLNTEIQEHAERAIQSLQTESIQKSPSIMQLHLALGRALLHKSWEPATTGAFLAKTLQLATDMGDVDSQLRAQWAVWTFNYTLGDYRQAGIAAEDFCRLAVRTNDPGNELIGNRLMGNTMHYTGNQPEARRLLQRMLEHYDPSSSQRHRMWFTFDQRVLARTVLARVLWLQGDLDQATRVARTSVDDAFAADHTLSICYALAEAACPIAITTGDLTAGAERLAMLLSLTTKHKLSFWNRYARCLEGRLIIRNGELKEGCVALRRALDDFSGTSGQVVHYVGFLVDLAEGLALAGRTLDGLATIEEALSRSEQHGVHWCTAEARRVKGELLLAQKENGAATPEVEGCFLAAIELAQQQRALFWELRAILSFARLRLTQGRQKEAWHLLASVCGRFTEGFQAQDLKEARALMSDLSAQFGNSRP